MIQTLTIQVTNAGIGGQNSRALLARLDSDVLSRGPGLVALMVGTNDARNSASFVSSGEYRANLAMLAGKSLAADCRVLLATIAPFQLSSLLTRHRREIYGSVSPVRCHALANRAIRKCARELNLPLANVKTVLSALGNIGDGVTSLLRNIANCGVEDGVHPTADGYTLIASVIYQAILDHNLPVSQIVCFGDSITFDTGKPDDVTATGATYPGRLPALLHHKFAVWNSPHSDE